MAPAKKRRFLQFFHNINYHNQQLLQTVFSECTEANATSLIPLDTILPEICAFIIGFPLLLPNIIRKGRGCQKLVTEKPFTSTVNEKKEM